MADALTTLSREEWALIERSPHPAWTAPMLATPTDERFSGSDWIYERKLDGERALAFRDGGKLRLLSRNRKDIGNTYPELVDALSAQACNDFVVDGEIVAFSRGITSFSRLQRRMQLRSRADARASGVAVYLYLFDIMHLNGHTLDRLPLRRRKALLKQAISFGGGLRYTAHRNRDGLGYYEQACEKGWEGVIAKRACSGYRHSRSLDWLKFKCANSQELVIAGYTEPKGARIGFGALLVGYYDDNGLRYAGKVGTGFDREFLSDFRKRLDRLSRDTSPFVDAVDEKDPKWVSPTLVGEFGFTEWTRDGKLRHPRFLGLRRDKKARDVGREKPTGR